MPTMIRSVERARLKPPFFFRFSGVISLISSSIVSKRLPLSTVLNLLPVLSVVLNLLPPDPLVA